MNILKAKFSTVLKVVMVCAVLFSFSCSGDDDGGSGGEAGITFVELPATVLGEYEGVLTYSATGVVNDSGTANIVSTGDNVYKITFSDNVPELTGFRFIKSEDGKFASASSNDSAKGVAIDDGDLAIDLTKDGNSWAFSGSN